MHSILSIQRMDWAGDRRLRLKQDLSQTQGSFGNIARNCMVGGVLLLIGLLALVGFLTKSSQYVAALVAVTGLFIGSVILIRALVTTRAAPRSVHTLRAWQRIASCTNMPQPEVESRKWEKSYLYDPLRIGSLTPHRVDRTRSTTIYCGINGTQADTQKRAALADLVTRERGHSVKQFIQETA